MNILNNYDLAILAGGLGKRLAPVTKGRQKVLASVGAKPFLEILIDYIAAQGGQRFILCTGHGAEEVEQYFQAKKGVEIIFSREEQPLGTGGALKRAAALVGSAQFLAMNGDCFCVIDYNALIKAHTRQSAQATIAVTRVDDAREYGTIEVGADHQIKAFKEKSACAQLLSHSTAVDRRPLINTGTYCLDRNVFDLVSTAEKFSIEYDFFPHLVGKNFYAFEVANKFIDIGTPERYAWAQQHLKGLAK